jgi:nucleotide-binding universal stress UspA family protein
MVTTLERLLVPLDLSSESELAVPAALRLAALAGVPISLFSWSPDEGEVVAAKRYLVDLANDLPADVSVHVSMTTDRTAAPAIARAADDEGATVCMPTHGRSGLGYALLGTVAEEVLRLARGPVVLVGPRVELESGGDAGTVVACVDGSPVSEGALPTAAAWARHLGAPLELVHVVEPTHPYPVAGSAPDFTDSGYLAALANRVAWHTPPRYDVLHGDPATAIARHASTSVELLALATHGRSGLSRAVVGSVAMRIVHRASCPVLLVHASAS